jgi:hypothetical protein
VSFLRRMGGRWGALWCLISGGGDTEVEAWYIYKIIKFMPKYIVQMK